MDAKSMEVDFELKNEEEKTVRDSERTHEEIDVLGIKSLAELQAIISQEADPADSQSVRAKEQAIYRLGEAFAQQKRIDLLQQLLVQIRPFFVQIPKAKTARIVRMLIDLIGHIPNTLSVQIGLCNDSIEWCRSQHLTFLRQRIEAKLAQLYLARQDFKSALHVVDSLVKEVRKLDDKQLLVEIQLTESKVHHAVQNIPKAKAALTASRAAANAIYCPPQLQSQIDRHAGIVASEEKDFKTAFSYFFESFEGYQTIDDHAEAILSLKYMLLCKIMINAPSDVYAIIQSKGGIKYAGIELEAMKAVADAYKERSLESLKKALNLYKAQLEGDAIIRSHFQGLYENLLEHNLVRIIEPYSRVQVTHIAKLINLPSQQIEAKLSEMILDKKFDGILDQGAGDLIVFEKTHADKTYESSLETLKELNSVVDRLYRKAKKLNQA